MLFVSGLSFFLFFLVARPLKITRSGYDSTTLYLNRVVYFFRQPKISDNVVISTEGNRAFMVGEIVAGPGDTIKTEQQVLFINNYPYWNGFPDLRGKYYDKELKDGEYLILSLAARKDLLGVVEKRFISGKLWAIEI